MRKIVLSAGAAIIVLGSIGSVDAQVRYRPGYYGGGWGVGPYAYRRSGWRGGAVAAGLVGGLVLGGLAAAVAAPAYSYPYGYGYPPRYDGRYSYPAVTYGPDYGYRPAPYYYGPGVVYSAYPYAVPHEVSGGYRTVYRPGYGRVIVGGPPY